MGLRRIVGEGTACYHCMSRIVAGERLLEGAEEKEVFCRMLDEVAVFCGVEVLTFAVMSNHFHLLVRVVPAGELSDVEVVSRYAKLYGRRRSPYMPSPGQLEAILAEGDQLAVSWRRRLLARMGSVSAFMKTLKQRFSVWFNQTRGRFGTLWAERFKSVLVESTPEALSTVAAYIDLNPIRAGLVEDPAAYRWCGYAEAMAGRAKAREGIRRIFGDDRRSWSRVIADYRLILFGRRGHGKAPDPESVRAVVAAGGRVSRAEALRCRLRYFSEGAVIGSMVFVKRWDARRARAFGPRRGPPARPLEGADWRGLHAFRAPPKSRAFG